MIGDVYENSNLSPEIICDLKADAVFQDFLFRIHFKATTSFTMQTNDSTERAAINSESFTSARQLINLESRRESRSCYQLYQRTW